MAVKTPLKPVVAPSLPVAPTNYVAQHHDVHSNVLRLYFNQLNNNLNAVTNYAGGKNLSAPFIAAYDTTTQYATGNNTPTLVKWNSAAGINSFTLNQDGTATAAYSGIYKITFSLQLANNNNTQIDTIVWLRVNSADVVGSSTIFTLPARKSTGTPSYLCAYSEVVFPITAGDTIGLWWGTDTAASSGGTLGVYILAQAAQTSPMAYPSNPSAVGSITFVSAL